MIAAVEAPWTDGGSRASEDGAAANFVFNSAGRPPASEVGPRQARSISLEAPSPDDGRARVHAKLQGSS